MAKDDNLFAEDYEYCPVSPVAVFFSDDYVGRMLLMD